ncbi:hypothetical protein Rsub_00527 [Raphidocelis subcapitata]|uniref:RING-type E3 ubiquitin transferase n=1 Tax=Raphidocelis subcapitata TaxID=307507 RepID=A0A2V0NKH4_9CHLO|nr:hypothetical protein Rsub_00527 [Raphidocelis subcapitata]|eukprot:GBF87816.1 hypothetical protein Rsub_00527 [Raphidocelis subcapitata]
MAPTAAERQAAEQLRAEGNKLFQRGKFAAAAQTYTEAITLAPDTAALYVNRALCHKKLAASGAGGGGGCGGGGGGTWERIDADAQRAIELDAHSLKGNYLRGVALRELGGDLGRAISHLGRALEEARAQGDAIKDEIWRELARTQDAAWRAESAVRQAELGALRDQLAALARFAAGKARAAPEAGVAAAGAQGAAAGAAADAAAGAAAGSPGGSLPEVDWPALDRVLARAARGDSRGEVPSCLVCPLTMEVFRDPVVTRCGRSYERQALLEHLAKVGAWDPITRKKVDAADVTPNVALRGAVQLYLEEHGWAWHECY